MSQIAKPAPLGRGLSALFGDRDASYQAKSAVIVPPPEQRGATFVSIGWVQPGPYQPRRHFDDDAIKELADSIRARGILQPLLVRPVEGHKERLEIIAGERRWRAAQIAGLHEVPVIIRPLSNSEALEYGLIENVQRQDLSPLEEADGYQRLMEEFQHTQETLAKIVGKSRSHVANMMRLLSLPQEVREMIEKGLLSAGHARALITAKNPLALAAEIIREGMNVRQAEALAKQNSDNPQTHKKKNTILRDANITMLEKELERMIGLKTTITAKGKAGTVTLHYQSLDQLDDIVKKLRG